MRRDGRKMAADLMSSAMSVVASDGFDKATTRSIANACSLPDAYIYSYYKDKEDLFYQAYRKEDIALAEVVKRHLAILEQPGMEREARFRFLFGFVWNHLMQRPDSCRFCVQYYYSPYYRKYSAKEHSEVWQPLLDAMSPLFSNIRDVKRSLRLVLNTTLSLAVKTLVEGRETDDETANGHFEMVYSLVAPYLKTA